MLFGDADDPEVIRHAWSYDARELILSTTRGPSTAMGPAEGGLHVQNFNDTDATEVLRRFIELDSQSDSNREPDMGFFKTLNKTHRCSMMFALC